MATVAVVGGGISGLSCAHYLKTLGRYKIKYLFLLEKNPKFGGWIQTSRFPDGAICEHGPRTLRVPTRSGYSALELADELNLNSRILPITKKHPSANLNLILSKDKLHPLPSNLSDFFKKTPPFSKVLMSYVFKEVLTKPTILDDESVYSFFERRIGKDISDFVFDPMCRGIAAGDARELSVRSMFQTIYENEQQHGSIIKGLIKNRNNAPIFEFAHCNLVKQAYNERWRMWTLKTGLTELIDALACSVEEREFSDLIFNAECSQITFKDNKAELAVENEKILVDHVFSCVPSCNLANLIPEYPKLCDALKRISFTDLAVVYLEYTDNVLNHDGFGFLSPSFENAKVLGIVFDSNCFPSLNGTGRTRLTCMMGGKWFRQILGDPNNVSNEHILKIATEEAKKHLGIQALPVRTKVFVQRNCIPQYVVGHYKKLEAAENEIKENNLCLSLLGASYKGAGVPDCIYNSKVGVQDYLKTLK